VISPGATQSATHTSMKDYDLDDPASYTHPTLSCDLIMKGGITSGVVYPDAACRLATRYRLKLLGGSSAGAIAAAFAAAAEHGRSCDGSAVQVDAGMAATQAQSGFARLHRVPRELGASLGELFQPSPATKALYQVMSVWLKPEQRKRKGGDRADAVSLRKVHGPKKVLPVLRRVAASWGRVVASAPWSFVGVLLLALLPLIIASVGVQSASFVSANWPWLIALLVVWLLASLPVATAAAAARLLLRTLKAMDTNGFGICDGHTQDPTVKHKPLTDWMAATIDELAGVSKPLTFGDLWGDQATRKRAELLKPRQAGEVVTAKDWREFTPAVDLKVMTTNLTFRRPYAFPFSDDSHFYFCEKCWRACFPDNVMNHLIHCTKTEHHHISAALDGEDPSTVEMRCPRHHTLVRPLPDVADMPIVVGVRLSLSFPGLISAVPLMCVDYSRTSGNRALIFSWFSDGGIASNFPMHFFDSPWPRRPTFGIDLQGIHPDLPDELVWRPANGSSVPFPRSHSLTSVIEFFSSMVRTMQNWADATQITLPGYRDRVTEVRIHKDEGGMNLQMPEPAITKLAAQGSAAACAFEKFDLETHEWIRYRTAMSSLSDLVDKMAAGYPTNAQGDEGYKDFLCRYGPHATEYAHLSPEAVAADTDAAAELMALAERWESLNYPLTTPKVPDPRPRLRQVPPL
jgi:predicted acylesterase/phospholipase RssA